jgi:hypothetical protein
VLAVVLVALVVGGGGALHAAETELRFAFCAPFSTPLSHTLTPVHPHTQCCWWPVAPFSRTATMVTVVMMLSLLDSVLVPLLFSLSLPPPPPPHPPPPSHRILCLC